MTMPAETYVGRLYYNSKQKRESFDRGKTIKKVKVKQNDQKEKDQITHTISANGLSYLYTVKGKTCQNCCQN